MRLNVASRSDLFNIVLMLISCVVAIIIPLELFLFSYAVLGPLHYLTEISWLHDRGYFTKGRYDALILLAIALLATLGYVSMQGMTGLSFDPDWVAWLGYIAVFTALLFAFVRNLFLRVAGILLIVLTTQIASHFVLFFAVFLPTLIHVYVFTGLFMLYGALKTRSRLGVVSVICLALCPVLLITLVPDFRPLGMSEQSIRMYLGGGGSGGGFIGLNIATLTSITGFEPVEGQDPAVYWVFQVFRSKEGIMLLRFIAFAYTYHYLNWFAKTRVIQWHRVPRMRFLLVLIIWAISVSLYVYDFRLGFVWLFALSYLHVLLELPLNVTSIAGIGTFWYRGIASRRNSVIRSGN